jgi:hypothetical protein
MKSYAPSLRYHSLCEFKHKIDPNFTVPTFKIYDNKNSLLSNFETGSLTPEDILNKIKSIDKPN